MQLRINRAGASVSYPHLPRSQEEFARRPRAGWLSSSASTGPLVAHATSGHTLTYTHLTSLGAPTQQSLGTGRWSITGAGTAFCAGGDIKGMGKSSRKTQMSDDERIADLKIRQRTLTGALFNLRKPTIAALPGPAAGAGLAIAMACDIRIAAESAFVSAGYARVGMSGDYGIAWLMTHLVGTARARELMYTADKVDAERCEQIGLFNRVVPDAVLRDEAFKLASSIAAGPSIALRNMKDNLNDALSNDYMTSLDGEAPRLVETSRTNDHQEAVRAFIEKRDPVFTGT